MTKLARSTNEYRHISTSQQSLGIYPGDSDAEAWKAYTEEESAEPEPDTDVRFSDCVILPYNKDVWENLAAENRLLVCSGRAVHQMDEYDTIQQPGAGRLEIVTTPGDLEWSLAYL